MSVSPFPTRIKTTARSAALKQAIVASFALDSHAARMRLASFEKADWLSVLWWLDISGMALYFYRRTVEIGADQLLPPVVTAGLTERLINNQERMQSLRNEAQAFAGWLEGGNVPYALLKGVTLTPHSVQESALRCQTDLDFLVPDRFADQAWHYAQRLRYRLYAKSRNTLEFRAGASRPPDLANIYSVTTQRALELHLAKEGSCEAQLLSRREMRECDGARVYSLSPADILIEQARHLLKHLCSEHTRLSWVLEFWRHVKSSQGDEQFWKTVAFHAPEMTHGDLAMGVAVWLAEDLFGSTLFSLPSQWRRDALPIRVRLWLERYARGLLLSDTIGNKLYALLQNELPSGSHSLRTTRQILLPRVVPAAILDAKPNETYAERSNRYRIEARFILWRLWFHFREGVRLALEVSRWRRAVLRAER